MPQLPCAIGTLWWRDAYCIGIVVSRYLVLCICENVPCDLVTIYGATASYYLTLRIGVIASCNLSTVYVVASRNFLRLYRCDSLVQFSLFIGLITSRDLRTMVGECVVQIANASEALYNLAVGFGAIASR